MPSGNSDISTHVATIVVVIATFISVSVILFFLVMAWRKTKLSGQLRETLEKSGFPCFLKSKDIDDKDPGNKGNFYTVTPKLNGIGKSLKVLKWH